MEKNFLSLNGVNAYKIAFHLSNEIWDSILSWDYFAKDTVGKQFVRAADSISANIAEGFGRYHKKDKIHFYRFSFGSVKECLDWNEKAKKRKLLTADQYKHFFAGLQRLPKEINSLIKFTDAKLTI